MLNAFVYRFGFHFSLRGGNDAARNNTGGIKHYYIKRKVVNANINHENTDRCVATFYEKYLPCRPVQDRTTAFYLRHLQLSGNASSQEKAVRSGSWSTKSGLGCSRYIYQKAGVDGLINH